VEIGLIDVLLPFSKTRIVPASRSTSRQRSRLAELRRIPVWLSAGDFSTAEPAIELEVDVASAETSVAATTDVAALDDFLQTWQQIDQPFTAPMLADALGVAEDEAHAILESLTREGRVKPAQGGWDPV
jgi:hypothetical protein